MNGFIVIDKPAGWTSFDVVAKVRGTLSRAAERKVKVGHAGTLDPFATGVLVLAIGGATKQIEQVMGQRKTYEATVKLGVITDTLDPESEEHRVATRQPHEQDIRTVLGKLSGEIEQIPPQFSALKVAGKRAYDLARAGKEVILKPRVITIHSLHCVQYAYPYLKIEAEVSKGTYIRSLARDIGEQLGVGGYCTELRRTRVGTYTQMNAVAPTASARALQASLVSINDM